MILVIDIARRRGAGQNRFFLCEAEPILCCLLGKCFRIGTPCNLASDVMPRTLKALFILAILGLSAYYMTVLYLAAHPKVSYAYRLYYLEMKTRFWNRNQTLAYIPGTRLDMVNDRPWILTRQGWSLPKDDGSGSEFAGKGGLLFTLHRVPGKMSLQAEVRVQTANTKLEFNVGEQWHDSISFTQVGPYNFIVPIPSGLFIADPLAANSISLRSNHPLRFQSMQLSHEE